MRETINAVHGHRPVSNPLTAETIANIVKSTVEGITKHASAEIAEIKTILYQRRPPSPPRNYRQGNYNRNDDHQRPRVSFQQEPYSYCRYFGHHISVCRKRQYARARSQSPHHNDRRRYEQNDRYQQQQNHYEHRQQQQPSAPSSATIRNDAQGNA